MQCIEHLSWNTRFYTIQTRDHQGQSHIQPISALPIALCDPSKGDRDLHCNGHTSLQSWTALSPDEVLALHRALDISAQVIGQTFYSFSDGPKAFVIPIGVLMCALFRPFSGMSRYLFAPQGLENVILPLDNAAKPQIEFFECARGTTGLQIDKAEGILNSLSWMYSFPSARRAWNSVLEYARQGLLDMRLPSGSFSFSGRGISLADKILITELQVKLLETTEEPYPAFSEHTKLIEFQRILHSERRMTGCAKKESDIPMRTDGAGYALTDEEWQRIQPIVEKASVIPRQFSFRTVIDGILLKLTEGIPWSAVPGLPFSNALLPRTYSRMQKDGRWLCLLDGLQESRISEIP